MAGELIGGRPGRHSGDLDPGALYAPPKRRLGPPPAEEEDDTPKDILDTLERLLSSPDLYRIRDRILTSATRGAAAGVLIKGGLHTLTFIMYLLGKLRGGKGRQRAISLADVLRDTIVHTAFFAALGSTYTAVDEGLALVLGKERTRRWRALVAGLIAGQTMHITGSNQRHYSLATYILLRGLTLLVRTGNKPSAPPALRALLRPTRLAHGDTLLMCAAASQILYSFIMEPSTLPPTYVRFINRMGGKDTYVWAAIREHALRNGAGLPPGPLSALAGTPLAYLNTRPGRLQRTPCEFFHHGQGCGGHAVSIVPQAYATSVSVYLPFYLVSSVLVHRQALLQRPGELLPKLLAAVLRSSAFLSLYIAAAFGGACAGFNLTGTNTGAVIAGSVWAGGLATLVEKKSRRMELAQYCAARALEAFIRCCSLWARRRRAGGGAVHGLGGGRPRLPPRPPTAALRATPPRPSALRRAAEAAAAAAGGHGGWLGLVVGLLRRADVLMFSLGCGAIMHCYSDGCGADRDVFRSKYLNVLDFIFGNQGVDEGAISHVPSNYQLVSTVGRHIRSMSRGVLSPSDSHAQCPSPLPRSAEPSAADMHSMRGRGSSYGSNLPYSSTVTAAAAAVGGGGHVRDSSGYMGAGQSQGQRRQSLQGEHGHGLYGRSSQHVSAGHSTNVYGSSGTHQQSHTYHSHHHHSEAGGSSYAHGSSPHSPVVQNGYPVQRLGGSSMGSALYGEEAAAHHGSHIRSAVSGPGCASTDCGRLPTSEADPAEGRQHHNHPLSAISIAAAAAAAGGVRQGPPSAASPGSSQPVSPIHGLLGHELVTGSGTAAWAGGQGMSSRSRSPSPQAPIAAAAAAVAPAAHTGPARSSGSSEDSGWEDVWAAATSGSPPERPGSRPVRHTAAVRQSKNLGEQVDAEAESAPASSSGLGAWAAQLVARALGGGGGGSKGGSWSRLAGWSTSQTGGGGGGGEPQPKTRGSGMLGRSSSSIRRTNTAPSLPTDALLLLSDPASEGRGHGRSSYQQLQLLADGGANGCGSGPGTPTHGSRSLSSSLGALGGGGGGGSASSGYLSASFCGGGAGRSMTVSSGGGGGGGESKLPPPAFRSRLVPPSLPQPIRRAPQGQSDAFYKVPLGGGRASHGNLIAAAGSAGGGGGASASVGSRLDSLAAATSWAAPQRPTAAGAAVYGSRTTASRAVAAAAAPVAATATSSSAPAQPRLLADSLPSFSCHVRPGALARAAASRDGGSDAGNERMEEEVKDREGRRHARAVLASVRSFTTTGLPIQVEAQTSQDRHQQQQKQQKQQGDGDGGTLAHLDMPSLRGFFHTHTSPVQQGAQPSWPRISLDWPAAAGGPGALRAALLANGEQVRGQQEGAETAGGVDEAAGMPTGLGSPTQVAGEVTVHDGVAAAVRGLAVQEEGDVEAVAQEVGEDEVEDRADGQGEAAGAGVSVGAAAVRPEAAAVVVKEGGNGGSAPQRVVQQGQGNGTGAGHGHGHRKKGKGKKGRK